VTRRPDPTTLAARPHPGRSHAQEIPPMRTLIRTVAPVLAALAIALGGASTTLAQSGNAAIPSSWDLDAEWCFDDVVLQYCFEVDGKAQFVDTQDRSSVKTTHRMHTVISDGDVVVGESTVITNDRFVFGADGTYTQQMVQHTRSSYGDEVCQIAIVWRQADFETVVDHWSGGCA
jgi:hypothetical protein